MQTQNSNLWQNQSSHFSNTLEETKLDRVSKQGKYHNIPKSNPAAASMSM